MKLDEIIEQIPGFKCKEGCHDCCGPVPFSEAEQRRVGALREYTSLDCPYIGKNGCDIYEERPIICRLFGAVEDLRCQHGCRPDVLMSREKAHEIIDKIQKL